MTRHATLPLGLGGLMGVMMIWLLHGQIISGNAPGLTELLAFVGAHVAVVAIVLAVPVVATPRLRRWFARFHRPDVRHVGLMLTGALGGAAVFHLVTHGVWH